MVIETLLPLMCASAAGAYNPACQSAIMAASKQTAVYYNVEKAENVVKAKAQSIAFKEVFVVGAVAVQAVRRKQMTYSIKNPIVADSLQLNASTNSGGMIFKWNLP